MKHLLLVAGEVSADQHGGALLKEMRQLNDQYHVFGIGGEALAGEGMELLFHLKDLAFLGVAEIIRHLPFIRKVKDTLTREAQERRPVAAILIDYPGFNINLARALHHLGIPVFYYISPQVWAWGRGRVRKIRRYVDNMIVLFPFEKEFYEQHGVDVTCVGHPLVDKHHAYLPKTIKQVDPQHITIGLLPGSRRQEVAALLPGMMDTVRLLFDRKKIERAEIIKVAHLPLAFYEAIIGAAHSGVTIVEKELKDCLPRYDAVMVASGTATLETGYFGVPMLIVYRVNPLTYHLGKMLIKVPYIGLVNIVAGKQVAAEFIQKDFTPQGAAEYMEKIIQPGENMRLRQELDIIREQLGEPGASGRAARVIATLLQARQTE
jgi:lipid-A-disaccharide synthase